MNSVLRLTVLMILYWAADAVYVRNPPKVQLYSREPGEFDKQNTLICHVSEFHPPDITIELLHNDMNLPNAVQTDLAFKTNWHFHLTRSAPFTPKQDDKFLCKVTHGTHTTIYKWEPNM